jgi:hypothetical protein
LATIKSLKGIPHHCSKNKVIRNSTLCIREAKSMHWELHKKAMRNSI